MLQEIEQQQTSTSVLTLFSLLLDMYFSMSLQEAAHLGVADHLRDGPRPVHALAQELGVQEDMLQLLLRVLSSKDIFCEVEAGVFAHTELSRYLQTDIPGSMASMAEMIRADWQRKMWTPEALTYTLSTGKSAFEHIFGEGVWSYLSKRPADYATLSKALTSLSTVLNETFAQVCGLSGLGSFVDVGGGEGSLLSALLRHYPGLTGTLFDLPAVAERASVHLTETSQAGRWTCLGGDFLQGVPAGADAYFLKQVLHDWSDKSCLQILRNCRQAIAAGGKLFIIEYILPEPPNKPDPFIIMSMVLRQSNQQGQQRTASQLCALLERAGFEFVRLTATNSDNSILEARACS
ncbi:MAG TPA: methyltransferase [Ktedonobacteraceae bacterium]|jgi:hypothetical protein